MKNDHENYEWITMHDLNMTNWGRVGTYQGLYRLFSVFFILCFGQANNRNLTLLWFYKGSRRRHLFPIGQKSSFKIFAFCCRWWHYFKVSFVSQNFPESWQKWLWRIDCPQKKIMFIVAHGANGLRPSSWAQSANFGFLRIVFFLQEWASGCVEHNGSKLRRQRL